MDYNQIKEETLKGSITDKLFPYLWEYYQDAAKELKVKTYEQFVQYFSQYINIPVLMPNGRIITPVQELMTRLPHIFKHLNETYKQKKEATEK
jgi:hypothetical protein